jgi:hypothetical protein
MGEFRVALNDGRLVSGDNNGTLRSWTGEGEAMAVLEGTRRSYTRGKRAHRRPHSLLVPGWRLAIVEHRGAPLAVLEGHEGWVNGARELKGRPHPLLGRGQHFALVE